MLIIHDCVLVADSLVQQDHFCNVFCILYIIILDMFRETEMFCMYRRTEERRIYILCEINCYLSAFESTLIGLVHT